MPDPTESVVIAEAIDTIARMSNHSADGRWLQDLAVTVAPHIKEWDVSRCYHWSEWPGASVWFPNDTAQDTGIDLVAVRRSDGQHIAIHCRPGPLNDADRFIPISESEIASFVASSADTFWSERWILTTGHDVFTGNPQQALLTMDNHVKVVNIADDLRQQSASFGEENCPHCDPHNANDDDRIQSRTCMQNEAVAESVRILKEHERSESGGLPIGQARGKIILPCATGKTRISLRIVEELTEPGELSIVLCPSIALVAQIRREYLRNATNAIRALAVCSDETAGYDPRKEGTRNSAEDPTLDNSNVSASQLKGMVTTNPAEIADWIKNGRATDQLSVIFGTYQSGRRISEALVETGVTAKVLIADEAHRTAGLRRKLYARNATLTDAERRIRDFTLCHDNGAFPATYRVYQTATPRIYDFSRMSASRSNDWIVRTMDDEATFGVELYRKSYVEAVRNGWLSDYRIIAVGVNDPDALQLANELAASTASQGRNALTTTHFLRGLAFALSMSGATRTEENAADVIESCIAFMNTVNRSKNMARHLQSDTVRQWLQDWLHENRNGRPAAPYTLEHLDANSNVMAREDAKRRLAESSGAHPHGIVNVGIFGEGTDSPSLKAVAFLEARKSPIDVIQAVGRAMRTAPGKATGYIICPIVIPPNVDPEQWLGTSAMDEGWQELGQILLALRAHDQRVEDNLPELLQLFLPEPPEIQRTIVALVAGEDKRIEYREHEGAPGEAQSAVERVLDGESTLAEEFYSLDAYGPHAGAVGKCASHGASDTLISTQPGQFQQTQPPKSHADEPTQIVTGKRNTDGTVELRLASVARAKPASDGTRGEVDIPKSRAKARAMINKGEGVRLVPAAAGAFRQTTGDRREDRCAMRLVRLNDLGGESNPIKTNLLSRSGLQENRVVRDLNLLESGVREAAHHLESDGLQPVLDRHFGLANLKHNAQNKQADGCTIAALLIMNAAMLHQRISNGRWLPAVRDLATLKNAVDVVGATCREWEGIMGHGFRPVLLPALETVHAVEESGKTAGIERALRHITAEAERIAETYADMGADHAGALFNRVMGNQASDGAYFTRPVAASIAARLTLDACGQQDWTDPAVWRAHKTVDLACGSGTLLAAVLADMKRRARAQGANPEQIASLQKLAVEETIKGLDINPVSLQLAASQLTAGNQDVRYRQMGLHLLPYGPSAEEPTRVFAGTLELLAQQAIVPGPHGQGDDGARFESRSIRPADDASFENAAEAARDARIVIMNPPFTGRSKMGEKFSADTQKAMRSRVDALQKLLIASDQEMQGFSDKRSIGPLFVALAEHCARPSDGMMTMVHPTIALTTTTGRPERMLLARRFHIQTVLTCHLPGQSNMVQGSNINESLIFTAKNQGNRTHTKFINLDRMPVSEDEVDNLYRAIASCTEGDLANGWGVVFHWPYERMMEGDWTAAIWRSPELAETAAALSENTDLPAISDLHGVSISMTEGVVNAPFRETEHGAAGAIPVLRMSGADGQKTVEASPDAHYAHEARFRSCGDLVGRAVDTEAGMIRKAGHLLVTAGQDSGAARLTAVAGDTRCVGTSWMPVSGLSPGEARALAVFINSTPGRIQLMRSMGRKLAFPLYRPAAVYAIRVPDIKDPYVLGILADCWDRTRHMMAPQFRDGECEVRRLWDEAVADCLGWNPAGLAHLRELLHREPHTRNLGYNQYADAE